MAYQNVLQRLIERRDKLTAAIEVLREETGEQEERRTFRKARQALAHTNGDAAAPPKARAAKPRSIKYGSTNSPFRGTHREIEAIPVPEGVSFDGIDFEKAVLLAIRAVKIAIPTPELTLLLETAGVKFPKLTMPRRRYVGMVAARLASAGDVKKTANGWQAKGKAAR